MIERILIENYRSIQKIDLKPNNICAFIGANNVGKSNILQAVDILLGETYPSDHVFSKDDFYNYDTEKEIKISIWFNPTLSEYKLTPKSGGPKEPVEVKAFHLSHNQTGTYFKVETEGGKLYWGNNEVRKSAPIVYIRANRNLEKQLSISEWTLLGKILKEIDSEFRTGNNEEDLKTAMEDVLKILKRPLKYQTLESTLKKNLSDQTKGLMEEFEIKMDVYSPLHYYKTMQILGKEWDNIFEITNLGAGLQNLILLALFRTYAELQKTNAILAIEEPEIYLYPHAKRQLFKIFRKLTRATTDNKFPPQIFYTTHSSNFVDLASYPEICIVRKDKERGTKVFQANEPIVNTEREELKTLSEFNQERNELFFARKVLLVEGNTEKHCFPTVFKLKKCPTDENGISIIEVGGKGNFPFFIKVLKIFKIPWVAVYDADSNYILTETELQTLNEQINSGINEEEKNKIKKKKEKHEETIRKNSAIKTEAGSEFEERLFALDPNFEKAVDLPGSPDYEWKKIRNARKKFEFYSKYEEISEVIRNPIEKLINLPELERFNEIEEDETPDIEDIPF